MSAETHQPTSGIGAGLDRGEATDVVDLHAAVLRERPEPVEAALALLPDHPPARFRWRGRTHRVVRADPAERIADEWWREQKPTRDYFRVEDEDGRRFWLRRDGLSEDGEKPVWSLHGLFA